MKANNRASDKDLQHILNFPDSSSHHIHPSAAHKLESENSIAQLPQHHNNFYQSWR